LYELIAVNAASVLLGYLSFPGLGVFSPLASGVSSPKLAASVVPPFLAQGEVRILFYHVMFGFDQVEPDGDDIASQRQRRRSDVPLCGH
jgi:hypothetical protein